MIIRRHQHAPETGFLDARAVRRGTAMDEAEMLGENFIASAISGEESLADTLDVVSEEEEGGPYLEVSAKREFALDVDASNPEGSSREAFPTAVHGPRAMRERRG